MSDTTERTWSRCPLCDKWKPTQQMLRVSKGFLVRGYRYFYLCKRCALEIKKRQKKR